MNSRTKLVSVLGLSLALLGSAAAFAGDKDGKDKKAAAKNGEAAPTFTLKDTKGKEVKLADYSGKIVVLEWFNNDCPYCQGVYKDGVVKKTLDEVAKIDPNVVYLAINSTANKSKEDVIAGTDKFMTEQKMTNIPVLIDYDGTVGRAYGAKKTPHVFVIDTKGVLRYNGAYIEKADNKDSTNYVVNAVKQIKAGETVSPDTTTAWGCGIKWASNNNDKNQGAEHGKPGKENNAGGNKSGG